MGIKDAVRLVFVRSHAGRRLAKLLSRLFDQKHPVLVDLEHRIASR